MYSAQPITYYLKQQYAEEQLIEDSEQLKLAETFDSWLIKLGEQQTKRSFFNFGGTVQSSTQGMYVYGGTGRGKTLLMDAFFSAITQPKKQRLHFQAFMQDVHRRIYRQRQVGGSGNPVEAVAKKIISELDILCLDEFQVEDITDAMLLSGLFSTLFEHGLIIFVTSNRAPADLYLNGLQREQFLPCIDLLKEKLQIYQVPEGEDFRYAVKDKLQQRYITPDNARTSQQLKHLFDACLDNESAELDSIEVNGRAIEFEFSSDKILLTSFDKLCRQALGSEDYMAIAERYETIFLLSIPVMTKEDRNEARRFVNLIDALYDSKTILICTAEAHPDQLYEAGDGAFAFERTASRLMEMQQEEYLTRCRTAAKD